MSIDKMNKLNKDRSKDNPAPLSEHLENGHANSEYDGQDEQAMLDEYADDDDGGVTEPRKSVKAPGKAENEEPVVSDEQAEDNGHDSADKRVERDEKVEEMKRVERDEQDSGADKHVAEDERIAGVEEVERVDDDGHRANDEPAGRDKHTVSSGPDLNDALTAHDEQAGDDGRASDDQRIVKVEPVTVGQNGHSQKHKPVLVPLIATGERELSAPEALALRRARINRKLLLRRRRERSYNELAPLVTKIAIILLVVLIAVASSGVGAAYAYYQSQLPIVDEIAHHSLFQTTNIYDRNGHLLYQLYDHQLNRGRRTYVNYSDISPLIINATVAVEDKTFWTNSGVDPVGITRAAIEYLQAHAIQGGGSTITQQLVKTLTGNDQISLSRKIPEAALAVGLTQQYPKWKIMEMYLNSVYYGDLNYGIEAAAQDYFGLKPQCSHTHCKPAVAQLDLAQASMLAGLPQSPSYYNPITNKSAALDRQMVVLESMVSMGMITKEQMTQAHEEMAKYTFKSFAAAQGIQAPHFVRYVVDQVLVPLLGAQNLEDGGYNVYTTLDLGLEKKVEQIVHDDLYKAQQDSYFGYYGPLNITNNVNNAAAIVMNPRNGEILAMDGSANYNDNSPQVQGEYNAALALRQPGSSFKPVVYSTAFEMGWYPAMIIPDHKTIFPGNLQPPYYSPQNYDGKFHTGFPMTVRAALANSFNIPAVDAIMFAGIPNVLNMAARLGLTEVASKPMKDLGPSMALGAVEVSLLHLTGAYATFANQGVRVPQTSVLEITDNQGHVLYKYDEAHPHGVRVMSQGVAFLMSSILSDKSARYHEFFPGNPLELDRPAAAKTGTTDSFRDNWTMGYTPYLTTGVWAGNSDNSIMNNVIGITGAGPIWHDIMEYASQRYNLPKDDFVRPGDVHAGTVSTITGLLPHPGEPTITDWFIDGTMPTIQGSYSYTNTPSGQPCHNGNCRNKRGHCHGQECNPVPLPNGQPIVPPTAAPVVNSP